MADAVIFNTSDLPTVSPREKQPQAKPRLTPQQIKDIERTWKVVEEELGLLEVGIELFKNIFTVCPAAQQMFKRFCDVPFEKLPENEHFRAHGLQVTESISLAVSTLDDLETLVLILKDLGAAHLSYGLNDSYFEVVGGALITALAAGLGDEFTPELKEAYVKFYGMVTKNMKLGLKEAMEEEQ